MLIVCLFSVNIYMLPCIVYKHLMYGSIDRRHRNYECVNESDKQSSHDICSIIDSVFHFIVLLINKRGVELLHSV